jgi:zinc and cadmium transporter
VNLISILLLFFSAIACGLIVAYIPIKQKTLKLILAFSGSYLFAISLLHLVPEIYAGGNKWIGAYILAGFFLQLFLEFFSEGIEHGHIHIHTHGHRHFPWLMMAGLCLHALLEAMPLAENVHYHLSDRTLLAGIVLHNVPIAMALMTMLLGLGFSKKKSLLSLTVFAAMAPLGIFTSYIIGNAFNQLTQYFDMIMGMVIGIFLHISTTILFESSENHRFNLLKFVVILLGAATAALGLFF